MCTIVPISKSYLLKDIQCIIPALAIRTEVDVCIIDQLLLNRKYFADHYQFLELVEEVVLKSVESHGKSELLMSFAFRV